MTYTVQQRARLFWGLCIPLRATLAMNAEQPALRVAAAVIASRWLLGLEDAHIGQFGGVAWWAEERPWHGMLWAAYAVSGNGQWLWLDTFFGAANWLANSKLDSSQYVEE